ncbi:MAG TPA: nicotinate-nucleotide adenylyltransferase [Ktedonobacteraceae bacterium]|nr:nicotinate-nucleotide adenylyltransferase [Ktedonobacteraceae bacterium]
MQYNKSFPVTRRIGVIGGTFDPVHYGHLVIAEEVYAALDLEEMVFVPTGQPPHKPDRVVTPAEHRLAMLERAIAGNPHFSLSRVDVDRAGPSYTVETLRLLRQQWEAQAQQADDVERIELSGSIALYFVIGWDSLEYLLTWHDPAGILEQLDYLVAVKRPRYNEDGTIYLDALETRLPGLKQRLLVVSAPQLDISSTDLRARVAQGRPIKYQLPESVEEYIREYGLYSHAG